MDLKILHSVSTVGHFVSESKVYSLQVAIPHFPIEGIHLLSCEPSLTYLKAIYVSPVLTKTSHDLDRIGGVHHAGAFRTEASATEEWSSISSPSAAFSLAAASSSPSSELANRLAESPFGLATAALAYHCK